jgi:hypothetical protein
VCVCVCVCVCACVCVSVVDLTWSGGGVAKAVDYAHLQRAFAAATAAPATEAAAHLAPLPGSDTDAVDADPAQTARWHARGAALIAQGKVGILLMAGGQVRPVRPAQARTHTLTQVRICVCACTHAGHAAGLQGPQGDVRH